MRSDARGDSDGLDALASPFPVVFNVRRDAVNVLRPVYSDIYDDTYLCMALYIVVKVIM